jgi:hypothetical protein
MRWLNGGGTWQAEVVAALKARWGLLPGLEGVLHLPPLPAEGPSSMD